MAIYTPKGMKIRLDIPQDLLSWQDFILRYQLIKLLKTTKFIEDIPGQKSLPDRNFL